MKKLRITIFIGTIFLSLSLLRGKIIHETFDSRLWKTANLNSEENMSLRWDMMNDLRNKYTLVGMTKKEIINLLGNSENTADSAFNYSLGYSRRGINTGTLTITFNKSGIVTEARVWQG